MKKNDRIHATCLNYTFDGHGVVKVDGFPLFVKGLLIDEQAEIVITMLKKTYGYGKVLHIEQPHPQRADPVCPQAIMCGGCQLQHMSLEHQCFFKKQQVEEAMHRIAHIDTLVEDVITMETPYHYRNKSQIPIGLKQGEVVTGFYRINSNDIIDMQTCHIQSQRINEVLACVRSLLTTYGNAASFRHLVVKHAYHSDELMIAFVARSKNIEHLEAMVDALVAGFPMVKSIILNLKQKDDNVVLGEESILLYGSEYITDRIHDLVFRISLKSFYQVNPIQTEVLYGKALEYAQLTGKETVVDLYCGVGTISMFLAQKAKRVIGIEIVPQAIEDAKVNASLNELNNIEFYCSDAASYASKIVEQQLPVDVVVVDPPRKGCDDVTLSSIVKMQPERIVYVSCKVSTLARDIAILSTAGYNAVRIQPVDMFCMTYGIETVVLLEKQ